VAPPLGSNGENSGSLKGLSLGGSHPGGSPSSRMAAAIRARRERANSNSGGLQKSLVQARGSRVAQTPQWASAQSSVDGAIATAEEVKQKYLRGQRDFSLQSFKALNLPRTTLPHINFNQAKMPRANFQGADLRNANFGRANLSQANLRNAKLAKAYFHNANLEEADLRGANLAQACLSNANLRGANLCGADLTGALIGDDQLASARTSWSTVLPNGRRSLL
ncbi:MAG TPA: pentapeptide repeat-containing protein, partial [Leptolyngbyaceae cyanobacterium M65_K2018_010]|nr:pentapeptide repeat-containing protein [Leptolyngbyaceae cyanobacterium M65_K2018_010]